jgi:hypothetical protein
MRGTIGRGAVQDRRRRMEARLLRKLQPIGAVESGGQSKRFPPQGPGLLLDLILLV